MKLLGNTEPTRAAIIAPAKEAKTAPTTKAISFELTVLIPIASATCSSSLIAIHERPSREACKRQDT